MRNDFLSVLQIVDVASFGAIKRNIQSRVGMGERIPLNRHSSISRIRF